ncbi:hypothetical protein HPB52_005591 [Rhipicephalus sanguineus]|uniref:Uncharacterized protein n=1 Tax=Rhipicephalus sanguineus TaxID=34632 RepID=A0A9D4QHH7_RHISA|nr:hypothetical protein HPB52_005591 [Rhipicephalus sanguineus]
MPETYRPLWWILADCKGHNKALDAYRAFYSEQTVPVDVSASFLFREVYCEPIRSLFEKPIYQLDCAIEWSGVVWFGPSAKHLQVSHAWCNADPDKASGKALFLWLVPSRLEASQLATHPADRYVSISSMSFDTLARLVERVLYVDFRQNNRNTCEGRVAEYRLIAPYPYILKVLINEIRLVEIYLHLKISAMLVGKVVNLIPSRPGSAAVSAPRILERRLTTGCDCIGGPVRPASLCGGLFTSAGSLPREACDDAALAVLRPWDPLLQCAHLSLQCPGAAAARWTNEIMVQR